MPGRVIQAMRRAEVVNPVILLDEIDKLGQRLPRRSVGGAARGARSRAEQGVQRSLPRGRLRSLAGAVHHDGELARRRSPSRCATGWRSSGSPAISTRRSTPSRGSSCCRGSSKQHGIDPATVTLDADVIPAIVHGYTREAGVRELERRLARLARKLARARAERRAAVRAGRRRRAEHDHVTRDDAARHARRRRRTIRRRTRTRTRSASRPGSRTRASAATCWRSR